MAILKIQHVGYQVHEQPILSDINLAVDKDDYLTITGPSGGGKSTLLKIIATMISATTGDIFYQGKNINRYDPISYRREISYCFQQPTLFGKDVLENLSFPAKIRQVDFDKSRAIQLMQFVKLDEQMLAQPITELSGGEKQRVALIRNLMYLPKILLLDEVTTGLDTDNKVIVWDLIERLKENSGITLIAVTHDEQEIAAAKHLARLKNGRLEVQR